MKRILIVEDDENLSRGIAFTFDKDGFHVLRAGTIKSARILYEQNSIDLIILDLGLPDGNGIDFCKTVREKSNVPIIMLTACDLETDEVQGLMSGADDYITKPFSLSVLRARVDVMFRRIELENNHIIKCGQLRLDVTKCKFYKADVEVSISTTEFRLLHYFMSNAGQVLTKEQILSLWDNQGVFVDENTLPVNINRLRVKVESDPKKPEIIKTIHGLGYVWVKE